MNSPLSGKQMLSVRIPKELNKSLGAHVAAIGASKNSFILMLIAKELQGMIERGRSAPLVVKE